MYGAFPACDIELTICAGPYRLKRADMRKEKRKKKKEKKKKQKLYDGK